MSETWLHRNIHSQLVCPSGYTIVRKDRSDSRAGGEVAIACRNDWKIATLDNNSIFLLSPVRDINSQQAVSATRCVSTILQILHMMIICW